MAGDLGEDAECHAAKLLEVLLIQFKGKIDQVWFYIFNSIYVVLICEMALSANNLVSFCL